jgi:hypothetical protein
MLRDQGLRAAALGAALLLWLVGAAVAEEPAGNAQNTPQAAAPGKAPMPQMHRGKGACQVDAEKHCADQVGKPEGMMQCLQGHMDELSPTCRDQMQRRAKWAEGAQRLKAACGEDSKKHCAAATAGRGGIVRCLREHESELSDACKQALPPRTGAAKTGS